MKLFKCFVCPEMDVTVPMNCMSKYLHKLSVIVEEPSSLRKIFDKMTVRVFSFHCIISVQVTISGASKNDDIHINKVTLMRVNPMEKLLNWTRKVSSGLRCLITFWQIAYKRLKPKCTYLDIFKMRWKDQFRMEEEETVEACTMKPVMMRKTCVPFESHALSIVFLLATIG
jgi:hypothetical protein